MKLKDILLKLFPYIAAFICGLAIIIFVLMQMSAIGWYTILTSLVIAALWIWRRALIDAKTDERINRESIRRLEERIREDEEQIDFLLERGVDAKKPEF